MSKEKIDEDYFLELDALDIACKGTNWLAQQNKIFEELEHDTK